MVSSGISGLGIVLNFECGVRSEGTLSISIETAGGDGSDDIASVSVPVGP